MKKTALSFVLFFIITNLYSQNILELNYPKKLNIIKRSEWGWKPSDINVEVQQFNYLTIHHEGVEYYDTLNVVEKIKALQNWSREEKKWNDIPYHFMIDLNGIIYETRPINFKGDTNTEYDPTNHIAIELMGNYEIQEINQKQFDSMIELLVFLSKNFNISIDKIKGHKDYSKNTVCPGKNLYKYLENGYIYKAVKEEMNLGKNNE